MALEGGESETVSSGRTEPKSSVTEITEDPGDGGLEKRPVPDGGWGWFVVAGSTLSQIILGGLEKSRGVIYPELVDRFGSNSAITAWVISMTGLLRLCGGPVASVLADRFGIRPVVISGSLIISSAYISSAFAPNIVAMFFSYGILGGLGQMCSYAPTVIIVGLYFNKRRALAAGLSSAGIGIGTFVLPPMVELLLEKLGFTGTFIISAGLALNLCVCGALFRPLNLHWEIVDLARKRKQSKERNYLEEGQEILLEQKTGASQSQQDSLSCSDKANTPDCENNITELPVVRKQPTIWKRLLCCEKGGENPSAKSDKKKPKFFEFSLLKDFPFLSFCVTMMLLTMAVQIGQVFIATMARERGVSNTNSALLLSIMGGCDTIGRVGSGIAFDRPRIKPYRQYVYNVFLFVVGSLCCIFPAAFSFPEFAGISAAFGFFSGTYIAQKSVIIVDLVGADKLVYSFGMIICFQGVGFLVGPILSGVLIDHFKRYDLSFYFAGSVTFAAGFVFLAGNVYSFRRKRRAQAETTHSS